jgi:hypothetical protein
MPQPPNNPTPHKWAVTGQEEEPTIDEKGFPTTLHHVQFKTNTGHDSHVTLSGHEFTPANVAKAIEEKANHIISVHMLNSTNAPRVE